MTSPGGSNEIRIVIRGDNDLRPGLTNADREIRQFQTQQVSGFRAWAQRLTRTGSEAGRELGENLSQGARTGTDDLTQDVTRNVDDLRTRLGREGERAGRAMGDGVADGVEGADLDGQMRNEGEGGGGSLKAGLVAGALGAVAALATVGAAAGAAMIKAVQGAMAQEVDNDKLAAQIGLSPAAAERAGGIAGKVYAQAYGESLADVNDAIRFVDSNISELGETSSAEIESMTKKALDLANAFDADVAESTRAVGKLIKTGLVKDATEGFDLITRGFVSGADEAGDLLEVISEYSTQFREVGVSGEKALGLMGQMMRAGARDTDTAADAIKEFAILSKDAGNKDVAAAYKALHLNANEMFTTFTKGGPKADAAMKTVIERLKAMKNPVDQNAASIALFGTKSEDLGDALYAMDPTTAVASLGKVAGAADKMGDTLNDNVTGKVEAFKRTVEMKFNELGSGILGFFKEVADSPDAKEFMSVLRDDIMPMFEGFTSWIKKDLIPAVKEGFGKWLEQGADALGRLRDTIRENQPELEKLGRYLKIAGEALVAFITSDFATSALAGMIRMVGLFVEGLGKIEPVISGALRMGSEMAAGFIIHFGDMLNAAVHAFGWMPGLGPKLKKAKSEFDGFATGALAGLKKVNDAASSMKSPRIKPYVDTSQAYGALNALQRKIGTLPSIYGLQGGIPGQGYAHGGITGAATGGIHGGMRWVGEQGPELVELPYGSKVNPAGTSRNMVASQGGGSTPVVLQFEGDSVILEWIRRTVSVEGGGNVQLAFGKAGR